jgi:hypothetical protein
MSNAKNVSEGQQDEVMGETFADDLTTFAEFILDNENELRKQFKDWPASPEEWRLLVQVREGRIRFVKLP